MFKYRFWRFAYCPHGCRKHFYFSHSAIGTSCRHLAFNIFFITENKKLYVDKVIKHEEQIIMFEADFFKTELGKRRPDILLSDNLSKSLSFQVWQIAKGYK